MKSIHYMIFTKNISFESDNNSGLPDLKKVKKQKHSNNG